MTDMLTLEGITQPIGEWALDYGIPSSLILDRIRRGWPVDRAITKPMYVPPARAASLRRWAAHGRQPNLDEQAWNPPKPRGPAKTGKRYTHDGQTLSIEQWALVVGIPASIIRSRVRHRWSIATALTEPYAGVVKNLSASEGTGGGSLAQDIPQLEFLQ